MYSNEPSKKSYRSVFIYVAMMSFVFPLALYLLTKNPNKELYQNGQKAEATILATEDTGNRFNENPEVEISLQFKVNGKFVIVTLSEYVSPVYLYQLVPGKKITVFYDKNNPKRVALKIKN